MLWIVMGLGVLAGEANRPAPAPTPPSVAEAASFDRALERSHGAIAHLYVRHLRRSDIMGAAFTGLYEAARRPVPGSLAVELRAARADENVDLALGRWPRREFRSRRPSLRRFSKPPRRGLAFSRSRPASN